MVAYDKMTKKQQKEYDRAKYERTKEKDALDPSRVEARRQRMREYHRNRRTLEEYTDKQAEYRFSPAGQKVLQNDKDRREQQLQSGIDESNILSERDASRRGERLKDYVQPEVLSTLSEFHLKGGIYVLFPFDNIGDKKDGVFKVGIATNFSNRMSTYSTSHPKGYYFASLLIEPIKDMKRTATTSLISSDETGREITFNRRLKEVERFIQAELKREGAKMYERTTRLAFKTITNRVKESEWFYTNVETIHKVMEKAKEKFGGDLRNYDLDSVNEDTKKFLDQAKRDDRTVVEHKIYYDFV